MRACAVAGPWAVVAVLLLLVACGNSSSGGSQYSATNCPAAGITGTSTCTSCIQSKCSADIAPFDNACSSSDLSCACPVITGTSTCTTSSSCGHFGSVLQGCAHEMCGQACSGDGG